MELITKNQGNLRRTIDYMSFAFMAFWVGLFQKYDIIVATSPQFFTTWSASLLSKIRRKPWIFELRDLWPESIRAVGSIERDTIINILEKIELWLYKDANKVIAVTQSFKENLIARGIAADKIDVITNGSNLELFSCQDKDRALLSDLGLEDKFVVGYIGTHGMAHSLMFVINTIAKIKDPSIHFLFIGDGAMKTKIVMMAKSLELKNVTFLEPIPKDEVPSYLSIINVSLVPLKKSDTFKTVIPSKIFEAAAMLKPIILGVEGEAQQILEKYGAGLCFEPENEQDLINKILLLRNDAAIYADAQQGCKTLANAYDRKKLSQQMLEIITNTATMA